MDAKFILKLVKMRQQLVICKQTDTLNFHGSTSLDKYMSTLEIVQGWKFRIYSRKDSIPKLLFISTILFHFIFCLLNLVVIIIFYMHVHLNQDGHYGKGSMEILFLFTINM